MMNKIISVSSIFFLVVLFALFQSCKHDPSEVVMVDDNDTTNVPPIDTITCDSTNVTYPGVVYPILDAYCISCHSGATPSGALDFTDYGDVAFVAESGSLLGSIKHQNGFAAMPQGMDKLSDCEIALIEIWVNDTTFVLPPDTTACDSSNVTYPGTVYPIFAANCVSCHAPPAPAAGIDLTDFEDVAFIAQSGSLMGAIRHDAGFSPMPQNAPMLSECEILLVQKWINDTTFNPGGGGGGIPCDPDTVYFQNDILPLLVSSCGTTGCHDPGSHQDGVILTSYQYVMQTGGVEPFDPQESELYEKIVENDPEDRMPPPPASPLTADQKSMIYTWIAQGALNNHCEQLECDSVNVSFSQTVWPIIQNSCYGCHSGSNPSGGISLENYNDVVSQASIQPGFSGSLLGTITWTSGNIPMPQNGPQLQGCEIGQIRNWIDEGMLNN